MFNADHPITHSSEDRLDRSVFAKSLAGCLLDAQNVESVVIGLFGEFGAGKTSLINLIIEELKTASHISPDSDTPIIINFSAWSYAGHHDLLIGFFRRLNHAIQQTSTLKQTDRIVYLLESYASFFATKPILQPISWFEKLCRLFSKKPYAWELGEDITQIKAEINQLFSQEKHKIVITIDNIARLNGKEIEEIFQLIKSMVNFNNTAYLLALEKNEILHKLKAIHGNMSESYLEKIVQLPFTIPPISQQNLEAIFAEKLQKILNMVPQGKWDQASWANLYFNALKYLFKQVRDIIRYINLLHFSYSRLKEVINPVDFFTLTAIEIFMPSIYRGIRDNKDLFSDLLEHVYELDKEQIAIEKARCDEIILTSNKLPYETTLNLLIALFPRLERLYHPDLVTHHSDAMADELQQVCSPNWFNAYFRLSLASESFSDKKTEMVLNTAHDVVAFDQAVNRLNQDNSIIGFLDKMDNQKLLSEIPSAHITNIIQVLLDNGDLFLSSMANVILLDTPARIHNIIHTLLQRYPKREDRFLLLQAAISKATKSIYISVYELNEQNNEHDTDSDYYKPQENCDLSSEQLESLQTLLTTKIKQWANNGSLNEHPQLQTILTAWSRWGNAGDCSAYVEKLTQEDRGLLDFLCAIFAKAIDEAMTKYIKDPAWHVYLDQMRLFIAPEHLTAHATTLFEDQSFETLSERQQLALMIFLDLMQVKTTKIIPQTSP